MKGDPGRTSSPKKNPRGVARTWRKLIHYAALAVVLAAPLLFGGGPPWVQASLSAALLLVALAWAISRKGELPPLPFAGTAAIAVLVTLVQLVPLPSSLVGVLSPHALELRTDATGAIPAFLPLSLDVPATVLAGLKGLACLTLILVGASATQSRGRSAAFAMTLVILGGSIAFFSIVHRLLGAEKVYGIFPVSDMPGSGIFGPFVSGNHAASLFALAGILSIGCVRESEGPRRAILGVCGVLCGVALLSTGSRAGVMAAAVGVSSLGALWLANRFGRTAGLASGIGLLVVGLPAALLFARGLRNAHSLEIPSAATELKVRGWRDTLGLIANYPWFGVGRGAFEAPAAAYRANPEGVRLVFPENILLQIVSEWGVPVALALVAMFIVVSAQVGRRLSRWEPLFQAAACGVLAVVVHELADFGLEVPGVAFPTAAVLGLVAGRLLVSRATDAPEPTARRAWLFAAPALAAWVALVALAPWATRHTLESDGERAAALVNARVPGARVEIAASIARHPADYFVEIIAAQLDQSNRSAAGLKHLNRALRLSPQAPTPHAVTAGYLAALGRPAQAALEYRLAQERGADLTFDQLLPIVGFANLDGAVPRRPEKFMSLGWFFVSHGRIREADTATQRAVELAGGNEAMRIQRTKLALGTKDANFRRRTAVELAQVAETAEGLLLAADTLAALGDLTGAQTLLSRALENHPADGQLVIQAARILFREGDLDRARGLLVGPSIANFAISERVEAEQLLADIAIKEGHPELAEAARVRARMLGRMVQAGKL